MIVKIFTPIATFKAVSYNTNKIEKDKGVLMKVSGFGHSQAMGSTRPEDYRNYLEMVSATNKAVKKPQFHAVISAPGKAYDAMALTEIATQWLAAMGYEKQPYLIVFHKDTDNNHVHMVSTRIAKNGKKISSGFENLRAIQNLNKILGIDEKHNVKLDIAAALSYQFSTKAQFLMILESNGYVLKGVDDKLEVIKFGVKQDEVGLKLIADKLKGYQSNAERKAQLKAIFHKYAKIYDTTLKPNMVSSAGGYQQKSNGYTSEFSEFLKEKMGIVLLFHAKDAQSPYGYSIIDHSGKAVFKGSEIMALAELLNIDAGKKYFVEDEHLMGGNADAETKAYYAALLKAALYNYPDLVQGLHHQGLSINKNGDDFTLVDAGAQLFIPIDELLDSTDYNYMVEQFGRAAEVSSEFDRQYDDIQGINIAGDVDDEAIHGRNRRRQKQARTNTR